MRYARVLELMFADYGQEYADRVGIHRTYVSDIERGRRNPTITVVEKLAAPLDVSAGPLLR